MAGCAVGALGAGPLLGMGRWWCLLLTNLLVIGGSGLCLIENYTSLLIGRFIFGMATGGFSVFCPKVISEVAPTEIKGPAGSLSQICITFGILLPFGFGLFFGSADGKTDH